MKNFIRMMKDESGASAAEYALLLALIGVGIALAAYGLGGAIKTELSQAEACIESTTGVC